jgi:hypothetical protein
MLIDCKQRFLASKKWCVGADGSTIMGFAPAAAEGGINKIAIIRMRMNARRLSAIVSSPEASSESWLADFCRSRTAMDVDPLPRRSLERKRFLRYTHPGVRPRLSRTIPISAHARDT